MSGREGSSARWAYPALTALLSLAANPGALWPERTYFFRDFAVTFQPLHELFLRALRTGRWIFWNPYSYEGSALLPTLYPVDLLQVAWPGPVAASWLLTMHFPIAALGMYALARALGASRPGASAAGLVYSLSGLAQSSLNLSVFLQALALAPLVVLALRRAAARGGRSVPLAALALALSISTLAVEFVGQALLLGLVLGLVALPRRAALVRLSAATALGFGLAALPILLTLGIVSESLRHGGDLGALQRSVHPVSLLQVIVPNLFLSLSEPLRWGWPRRLFPEGLPYFLSFYVGPLALAAAANGLRVGGRLRWALLGTSLLGLWYALGRHALLAPAVAPLLSMFRFPSKALLLPCLGIALLAGLGVTALGEGHGFKRFAAVVLGLAGACGMGAWAAAAYALPVGGWLGVAPETLPVHLALLRRDAVFAGACALAVCLVVGAVTRGRLRPASAVSALVGLLALDLARAAWGLNPQTSALFFQPLPELRALTTGLEGGRVLSLGYGLSPGMTGLLTSHRPGVELASFFLYRQVLNPFANVLDEVDLAGGPDLHGFIPSGPLIRPGAYRPDAIGGVTRELRNAAVTRVISLDPIEHPEFVQKAEIATGLPGFSLHVYDLADAWPRAYVGCRVAVESDPARALETALAAGFDPRRDAVLAQPVPASCTRAGVLRQPGTPGDEAYAVEADAPGVLVLRDSYTPSWRATVDGSPAPVLRANGRHRAVPIGAGRHDVRVFYDPPLLRPGLVISGLALLVVAVLLLRPRNAAAERDGIPEAMV